MAYLDSVTEHFSVVHVHKTDENSYKFEFRDSTGRGMLVAIKNDPDGMFSNSVYVRRRAPSGEVGVQWHGTLSEFLEDFCGINYPQELLEDGKYAIKPINNIYAIEVVT